MPLEPVFFPTAAVGSAGGVWQIPVHGWIYRATELSRLRRAGLRLARHCVELRRRASPEILALFEARVGPFLADNERRWGMWFARLAGNLRSKSRAPQRAHS